MNLRYIAWSYNIAIQKLLPGRQNNHYIKGQFISELPMPIND